MWYILYIPVTSQKKEDPHYQGSIQFYSDYHHKIRHYLVNLKLQINYYIAGVEDGCDELLSVSLLDSDDSEPTL